MIIIIKKKQNHLLPALITADHVAVIVGEATDAAGDVSPIAAILRCAERRAP